MKYLRIFESESLWVELPMSFINKIDNEINNQSQFVYMKDSYIKRISQYLDQFDIDLYFGLFNKNCPFERNFYRTKYSITFEIRPGVNKQILINVDDDDYFYVGSVFNGQQKYFKIDSIDGLIKFLDSMIFGEKIKKISNKDFLLKKILNILKEYSEERLSEILEKLN